MLLQAFSTLDHEKFNLRLIFQGNGPESTSLKILKNELPFSDRIMFLGGHESVHKVYSLIDIFVTSSKNEGISNTILEAMATGLPVIATDVGGNL